MGHRFDEVPRDHWNDNIRDKHVGINKDLNSLRTEKDGMFVGQVTNSQHLRGYDTTKETIESVDNDWLSIPQISEQPKLQVSI